MTYSMTNLICSFILNYFLNFEVLYTKLIEGKDKKFNLKKYNSLYEGDIALSVFIHPPETLNKVNKYIQTLSFS